MSKELIDKMRAVTKNPTTKKRTDFISIFSVTGLLILLMTDYCGPIMKVMDSF